MESYFKLINTGLLDIKLKQEQFPFSKYLFWDSNPENIDIPKHKRYIVERVLTRGSLEDFYMLLKLYSSEEIKEAITKSKELDPKTVNFCSLYFNIPKTSLHVSSFYR